MNVGRDFLYLFLQPLHVLVENPGAFAIGFQLFELNRQERHTLVQIVVQLTGDATPLFFLSGYSPAAKIPQDLLDSPLFGDVNHESMHTDSLVAATRDAH